MPEHGALRVHLYTLHPQDMAPKGDQELGARRTRAVRRLLRGSAHFALVYQTVDRIPAAQARLPLGTYLDRVHDWDHIDALVVVSGLPWVADEDLQVEAAEHLEAQPDLEHIHVLTWHDIVGWDDIMASLVLPMDAEATLGRPGLPPRWAVARHQRAGGLWEARDEDGELVTTLCLQVGPGGVRARPPGRDQAGRETPPGTSAPLFWRPLAPCVWPRRPTQG
jgi:hypothetical protein